ncbi:MAG: type II toxin-antitoxin system VapC family toxin [Myxococcota bacterium]
MIFLDANVFMYAAGADSPQRAPCQRLLRRVASGSLPACTNSEVLQEILHRYRAIRRPEVGFRLFDLVLDLRLPILAVREEDLVRARQYVEEHPRLSTRDAVHLGTMRGHRVSELYSYDAGFDAVPWARRREPEA